MSEYRKRSRPVKAAADRKISLATYDKALLPQTNCEFTTKSETREYAKLVVKYLLLILFSRM